MFIVILTYKKPLEDVEKHLQEHRLFLDKGYNENAFIASGPRNPRIGGIIISQLQDRAQLESLLKEDPFNIYHIADYEIIEFNPTKNHSDFATFTT